MGMPGSPTKVNYQLSLSGADSRGTICGVGSLGAQVLTVQGTIPACQTPLPGDYSDLATIQIDC
jgi:spore coat protein U-like protein